MASPTCSGWSGGWSSMTSTSRRAAVTCARIRPVGVSRSEAQASPGARPAMSAVSKSPSQARVSFPDTRTFRQVERSTNARSSSSASTPLSASVLMPAIIDGVDVPTTQLVTNDFPPRVGGIQRTLEALANKLPADRVGVFCPSAPDASSYDAEAPFRVFRQPEPFLWPTRDVASRVDHTARELGAEVVLFG